MFSCVPSCLGRHGTLLLVSFFLLHLFQFLLLLERTDQRAKMSGEIFLDLAMLEIGSFLEQTLRKDLGGSTVPCVSWSPG